MASAIILESGELVKTNEPVADQTTVNPDSICGKLAENLKQQKLTQQPDEEV